MTFLVWTLTIVVVLVWVLSIVDIVQRQEGTARIAGWILLVVLLPIAGSIVYWIVREPTETVEQTASAQADLRRDMPGDRTRDF